MKDFQYYKNWAINHLKKQLVEENAVKKSLLYCEMMLEKSFPVGTIREWKGKKYKKVASGKWMRYYNSQNRGSNQALRYAIKQLEKIEDMETLAKFINANRNRFCNEYGKPLPEAEEILKLGYEKAKDIKDLGNNVKRAFTEDTRNKALEKINNPTDKMLYVEYTRENYNKLFPRGEIVTPIGKVKLSPHQFERLGEKDNGARKDYIGALFQTLSNPDVIIGKTDNRGRYGKIFLKAFVDNNGKKSYLALVPTIDGLNIVVSNSPRDTKDIAKEIKKADHYYYINESALMTSSVSGGSPMRNPDEGQISNDSRNEKGKEPSNDSNLPPEKRIVKKNTEKSVKTECKTIKELQNYARENYNIDIVYHGSAKTDSEECIKSFYEVEKMCKKLPGLNEYINTIEYINLGSKNNGVYSPGEYKIKIGNFQKNMEFEDFRFATGQDVTTVMQHEMTHAIQQYIFMNADEEDFRNMFENTRLGDKYIKRHRAMYKTLEDYKFNRPESFGVHKYKFYQSKIAKDIMNKAFKNLGMKPIKFGQKKETLYYIEKNPETGKYRYKKDSFTPEELAVLKVSFYSLSDPCELWSEAFTDYLQNGENAQPISKEIWKIVNEDYLNGELSKSILYIVKSILGEYVA